MTSFIIVDPDVQSSIELKKLLNGYAALDFQGSCTTLGAAEESIRGHPPDVAFIRFEKAELNAFRLADELKRANPVSRIIFTGSRRESAVDAFEYEVDGFLLIPFDKGAVDKLVRSFEIVKKDTRKL